MKPRHCLAAVVAAVLGIVSTSGCRTTVNTVENAEKQGMRQMVSDSRVITDASLNKKVNVVGVNTVTMPNGILRVQIEAQSRKSKVQTFFYSVEWFDLNGMQVSSAGGGWAERQILGREVMSITATAPSPTCKDFRLKLIEDPR